MLESVEIKNFRSCEDVLLQLGEPVVALLGKNGAGKTNVLHALQLVGDLCVGDGEPAFGLHPRTATMPTGFVLRFRLGSSRFVYRTSRSNIPAQEPVFEESLERDDSVLFIRSGEEAQAPSANLPNGVLIGTRAATLPTLLQILPQGNAASVELKPIAEYLRSIQYYPLLQGFQEHLAGPSIRGTISDQNTKHSPFIEMASYEAWRAGLIQGRPLRSVQMRLLHLSLTDQPRLEELKTLLGENGLGLLSDIRIDDVRPRNRISANNAEDSLESVFVISFMPAAGLAGSGRWFHYSGLSAGTWRILQLLTYLIFDESSCMLLEQPEDSIHPGLLAKVIDILRTYASRTQLICTTHSPRVMNLIGPSGIRFVTATDGNTSVSVLSTHDLQAANRYLEDEGTLAEFLDTL